MPIINATTQTVLTHKVAAAENFLARTIGLLGTENPDPQRALYLAPCRSIHTFGMKYPLDLVFLDGQGKVAALFSSLAPNKVTGVVPAAKSVLELPPGAIRTHAIRFGDKLKVEPDERRPIAWSGVKRILHWPANLFMALLWTEGVLSLFTRWQANSEITSLGLILVNTLLVLLFLTRRASTESSHRILDWIIPLLTVALSLALRPQPGGESGVRFFSSVAQLIGILLMLGSLASLGRSFGIIPAHRRIKHAGTYKVVRHPLYTSEMLFYLGFLAGNFSVFNFFAVLAICLGQVWRALAEEKLLRKENQYVEYMRTVRYRFLPGIV